MLIVKKILKWCINILWYGHIVLMSCRFIRGLPLKRYLPLSTLTTLKVLHLAKKEIHRLTVARCLNYNTSLTSVNTIINYDLQLKCMLVCCPSTTQRSFDSAIAPAHWNSRPISRSYYTGTSNVNTVGQSVARIAPARRMSTQSANQSLVLHRHVECQHSRPIGGSHSWYYQFSRPVFLAEGGGGGWKAIISSVSQSWGRAFPITLGKETRQSLVLPTHLLHFKSVAMSWNALKSTGVKNCGLALFALENLGERWEKCMSEFYDFSLWSNIWYTADQCHLAVCMSQRTWAKYKGFLTHIEWP